MPRPRPVIEGEVAGASAPATGLCSPRTRAFLAVGGIILVFVVAGARWLWLFRHGQPLSVDESLYLAMALSHHLNTLYGGIEGFIAAYLAPRGNSPLPSAIAGLMFFITGPRMIAAFAVPLLAGAGTVAAAYFMGAILSSRAAGVISAALVASCPIIVVYARCFQLAMPAAFVTTLALLALLLSARCSRFGWATVFGICVGLMPLMRVMNIAFIPGLLLGAVIYTMIDPADRRRRMLIMAWSFFVAAAVAATWLVPNGRIAFGYLTSYGYGSHAAQWGPANAVFSLADLFYMVRQYIAYLHLPHFVMLLIGVVSFVFTAGRHIHRNGFPSTARAVTHSPLLPIVVYVGGAVAALASSQNKGDGFPTPIIPAALVLAVCACRLACESAVYRRVFAAAAVCVSAVIMVTMLDVRWAVARPWSVTLPGLGPSLITDGRGYIQRNQAEGGAMGLNPAEPISREQGRAWVEFNTRVSQIQRETPGLTAWGFRHYFFDAGTVNLYTLLLGQRMTPLTEVDPIVTNNTITGNVDWLTSGGAKEACFLLTTDDEASQPDPAIDPANMVAAATQTGFRPLATMTMPNGYPVTYWGRDTLPGCEDASTAFVKATGA